jgi:hypothetical protein
MGKIVTDWKITKHRADSLCECWICLIKDTRKPACGCFFKTPPRLAGQEQLSILIFYIDADARLFAEQNERWILESRASSLVKGFENLKQAWLVQAQPCNLLPISFIRVYPSHPWFKSFLPARLLSRGIGGEWLRKVPIEMG